MKTQEAITIAKAILILNEAEEGDAITNLKLQKLLYYVQGFHLAAFNRALFEEKIFAWQYGPVVKEIYSEYKENGAKGIDAPREALNVPNLFEDEGAYRLFLEVLDIYGQFSAVTLMKLTHQEPPWKNTKIGEEISHAAMKEYFLTQFE